ncbi:hypothetical protein ABVV53_12595 [Novosphingobium sp. RD2P27]|uniref:Uncharacterized protein n=1 Tax=Novosphingobium kalidii TaxID=3230299 RepID=A0ABV2D342_9SPHN
MIAAAVGRSGMMGSVATGKTIAGRRGPISGGPITAGMAGAIAKYGKAGAIDAPPSRGTVRKKTFADALEFAFRRVSPLLPVKGGDAVREPSRRDVALNKSDPVGAGRVEDQGVSTIGVSSSVNQVMGVVPHDSW